MKLLDVCVHHYAIGFKYLWWDRSLSYLQRSKSLTRCLQDPSAQLEQLRRNSLIGPSQSTPEKQLPNRKMVSTSAPIPEETLDNTGTVVNDTIKVQDVETLQPQEPQDPVGGKAGKVLPIFTEPDFGASTA